MLESLAPVQTAAEAFDIRRVAVVGAGVMGRGIVQVAARAGLSVTCYDAQPGKGDEAAAAVATFLRGMAAKGKLSQAECDAAVARITVTTSIEAVAGSDIVIEAIVEDLDAKQALLARLEAIVSPDVLLATNTSSLLVSQIAAHCRYPQRVAGLHFYNPFPLMRLVEVIPGLRTAPRVVGRLTEFVKGIGHVPVSAVDSPGFLVNHIGRGLYTEGIRIVSEGVAATGEVDRIARDVVGFRMGPFELFDLTGLDVSFAVLTKIYQQFYEEPRFRPHPFLAARAAAGLYGRKTGEGFYVYDGGKQVPAAEAPVPVAAPRSVWTAPDEISENPGSQALVSTALREARVALDTGASPLPTSIVVVAPLGADATTVATRANLPPDRCVALDTLFWPTCRHTLMKTVSTRPDVCDAMHAMLGKTGSVSVVEDSNGFVAQRLVASIVNIACEAAQQRIGSPRDIELAATLGLGYPTGPLALADRLGPRKILTVLDRIFDATKDPRYRSSPWLRRRAVVGIPLSA